MPAIEHDCGAAIVEHCCDVLSGKQEIDAKSGMTVSDTGEDVDVPKVGGPPISLGHANGPPKPGSEQRFTFAGLDTAVRECVPFSGGVVTRASSKNIGGGAPKAVLPKN